jgi:Amidohydrolase family
MAMAQVPAGAKIIDARGKLVMPGGIDPHTHLSMPFGGTVTCDDFYRHLPGIGPSKPHFLSNMLFSADLIFSTYGPYEDLCCIQTCQKGCWCIVSCWLRACDGLSGVARGSGFNGVACVRLFEVQWLMGVYQVEWLGEVA